MKITATQLRRIIKEEAAKALRAEAVDWDDPGQSPAVSQLSTLIGDVVRQAKRAGVTKEEVVQYVSQRFEEAK